jgi:N,N-dimethylformamidase
MPPFTHLIGYADRFSVAPGERIAFMVSAEVPSYEAAVVQLLHGDENPDGPGFRERELGVDLGGPRPGRRQVARAGSWARADPLPRLDAASACTLAVWVWPTRCGADGPQALIAKWDAAQPAGLALVVLPGGAPALRVACEDGTQELRAAQPLLERHWHLVAGGVDASTGVARLHVHAPRPVPGRRASETVEARLQSAPRLAHPGPLTLAAGGDPPAEHLDGKLEAPAAWAALLAPEELAGGDGPADGLVLRWDLAREPHGDRAIDVSGHGAHGRLLNLPTRAVTGRRWRGRELDVRHAPAEYGAVHFHHDDLEDAGWEADVAWTVPDDLPSGVYAARLRAGEHEDHIPFAVRPPRGRPSADVLLLLPTLTYLAYANERQLAAPEMIEALVSAPGTELVPDPADTWLAAHPEAGLSCYDTHADGSGCCYSSARRPIPNLRPRYRFWSTGGPERFAADLYLVDWLDHEGVRHDVAGDEDLHAEGRALLDPYRVVLTGTHPEYWTEAMLDALSGYLERGGRLMYLGGNGFYWVTSIDPRRPHVVEIRRGVNGTRAWTSAPGETHHSTTGEPGGLWRYRGRAPNALVGVGFTAQSDSHEPAAGYARCPDSFDRRAAFAFAGIGPDEVIGEFGLINGGAAGYEIDRADPALGTPQHALRLASSRGRHDDSYLFVIEDLPFSQHGLGGTRHPGVGADMVLLEYPEGGAVFSVGSCNWCASLSHHGYDNSVARITGNVLRAFATDWRDDPPPWAQAAAEPRGARDA